MRRLKSEVLADLPRKREEYVYAAMTPEQTRVYDSLMLTLREHVGQALAEGSLPRARMQVLSILLKLRQVCCHPKLFLPDYEGSSGKLELLVQIVHNAIAAKRRMLIFSQFVGMLQMIRRRLGREGIQTLYLDGETRPDKRQELCDPLQRGRGTGVPDFAEGRRHGAEPDRRGPGNSLRSLVEPRRRGPGDRPCAPHRTEA